MHRALIAASIAVALAACDQTRLGTFGEPTPKLPIVLAHGFSGFENIGPIDYFYGVAADLTSIGEHVYTAEVDPYGSSATRGQELGAFIDGVLAETGAKKVILIAHSQGGLDSRYMISSLHYGDRVAVLVTVATPHRGTILADALLGLVPGTGYDLLNALAGLLGHTINDVQDDPDLFAALETLSVVNSGQFAAHNPDDPRVAYYSVAGRTLGQTGDDDCAGSVWENPHGIDAIDPLLAIPGAYLAGSDLAHPVVNDGLVTVDSQKWGTFLGCVPADHLDEIGQLAKNNPDLLSGFDHFDLYRRIIAQLHADGY